MPKRRSWTLWVGVALIAASEAFLFIDASRRGWAVVGHDLSPSQLPRPTDTLGWVARWFAVNMTAVCWLGYLFVADGALVLLSRTRGEADIASIRARPNRFVLAWLTSIAVWCFFDWLNFYWMDAWLYHGLPPLFGQRIVGYFIAFAAISPGMFLAAQFWMHLFTRGDRGAEVSNHKQTLAWALVLTPWLLISAAVLFLLLVWDDARLTDPVAIAGSALLLLGPPTAALLVRRSLAIVTVAVGLSFMLWTFLAADPLANLTLWVGLIFLLDPLNHAMGAPSLLRDWRSGRVARTAALFAGGLTCGILWEFWNYWAIAKWTYHLPFLGPLEHVRYFEMPLPGMLGFLPFAAECWVVLNTILAVIGGLSGGRLRLAEPLPDPRHVF